MAELADALDSKPSSFGVWVQVPPKALKEKAMKTKTLKTRILREIIKNIQFRTRVLENGKLEYLVERKSSETGEWDPIARTTKIERALMIKHNAWHAQLSRMNHTNRLLNRRKYGKGTFFQKLRK